MNDTTRANGMRRYVFHNGEFIESSIAGADWVDAAEADAALASRDRLLAERDARYNASQEAMVALLDEVASRDRRIKDLEQFHDWAAPQLTDIIALRSQVERLEAKAESWDALMNCRMRTIGSAQVKDTTTPYSYLVIELWTAHPEPTDQPFLRDLFGAFMVKARAALSPPPAPLGYQPEAASPELVGNPMTPEQREQFPMTAEMIDAARTKTCGACGGSKRLPEPSTGVSGCKCGQLACPECGEDPAVFAGTIPPPSPRKTRPCPYCAHPEQASGAGDV